ncbi:unnamed protein product [Musa textilis]
MSPSISSFPDSLPSLPYINRAPSPCRSLLAFVINNEKRKKRATPPSNRGKKGRVLRMSCRRKTSERSWKSVSGDTLPPRLSLMLKIEIEGKVGRYFGSGR